MPTYKTCSVADVTLRVKADARYAVADAMVWYWGSWMNRGRWPTQSLSPMQFVFCPSASPPGLYYWGPWNNPAYWGGILALPGRTGSGVLAAACVGTALDAEVRFATELDGDGNGMASAYCNDVLMEEFHPYTKSTLADLVTFLNTYTGDGRADPGHSIESMRFGEIAATVWETVSNHVVLQDGAVRETATVNHDWRDWYDFVTTAGPGHDPTDYRRAGDMYADDASLSVGVIDIPGLAIDSDDCIYQTASNGAYLGELRLAWYRYSSAANPSLSITHDPLSGHLLVTDAGIATDGAAGHHKIMRGGAGYEWSERYPMVEA